MFGAVSLITLFSLAQSPEFEVVSIKPSPDEAFHYGIGLQLRHGTLGGKYVTLREMLALAYGVTEPRIIGPKWLEEVHFDIAGKAPEGVSDEEFRQMMQALLRSRFQLKEHKEQRELPVYNLVVAKGGVKMAVSPAQPSREHVVKGFPMMMGTATAAKFADILSKTVGRPVFDKTGLTATYNYALSFAPLTPSAAPNANEFSPPDILVAVQDQLGLKLVPDKGTVEVIVVDSIDRVPTEN